MLNSQKNKYLFVVAHADDEILGAGATISKISRENLGKIRILYITNHIKTRSNENLYEKSKEIYSKYSIKAEIFTADYVAQTVKFQEHYELVNFIEKHIKEFLPTHIFTHHPNDIHTDHREVAQICSEAFRYPQRYAEGKTDNNIKALYYISVNSSTDWSINHTKKHFYPTVFEPVKKEDIDTKIKILKEYENVIRAYPHPRAEKIIEADSMINGSKCGKDYAEGFETAIKIGI